MSLNILTTASTKYFISTQFQNQHVTLLPDSEPPASLTYESVLLRPIRNREPSPDPLDSSRQITSYAQIDIMLERMLSEVERQEKLFGLDLDVLDDPEPCVNSLTLEPSSDAIIEIPIKKRSRVYETKQEIVVDEDSNYEPVQFQGFKPGTSQEEPYYDLIQFADDNDKQTIPREAGMNLDDIQKSVTQLLLEVEQDEATALLNQISVEDRDCRDYKYPVYFGKPQTASSESLSDWSNENYPESWDSDDDAPGEYDYEPILSRSSDVSRPYVPLEDRDNSDIWWEGTYRNLSIVPEEDEENLSLLGSCYSNKSFAAKAGNSQQYLDHSGKRYPFFGTPNVPAKDTSMDDYYTDSSKSRSTDESEYSGCEKIVKAEVRILVKTSEKGKDEIEIRSVREFMDPSPQTKEKPESPEPKRLRRSQTLPAKLSHRLTGLTSKVSNMISSNKMMSKSYGFLSDAEVDSRDKIETVVEKPVFTLQRLFVRTPEAKEMKTFGSFPNARDKSGSRTELVPLSPEKFPLQYDLSASSNESYMSEGKSFDLFANPPFYPSYELMPPIVDVKTHSYPTEFVSNPFLSHSSVPQAYCDWLSAEDEYRGNVHICFRAKTHTHGLDFVVLLIIICLCHKR